MPPCSRCATSLGPDDVVCPICGLLVDDDTAWARPPRADGDTGATPGPPPGAAPLDPRRPDGAPGGGPLPGGPPPPPGFGPSWGGGPPASAPPGYGPPGYGPPGYGPPGHGGPSPGYWTPPVYVPPTYQPPNDGLAIAAFITSLAGLVLAGACYLPILACPVGAVLGHVALRRIAQSGKQGRGLALAGVIIGWIGTGLLVLAVGLIIAVASTGGFG